MALIKSKADIEKLRVAGKVLRAVLQGATQRAVPGASLLSIDAAAQEQMLAAKVKPAFLGFEGFPNTLCLSVNDQVVHGIPSEQVLQEGDILGIDAGLWYQGVCVDAAVTVPVGSVSTEAAALLKDTQAALKAGIKAIKPFRRVGAISAAIQESAERSGRGIVRSLTGHGVGHHLHEDPEVPNMGHATDGIALRPGMVLAIEPMLTAGSGEVYTEVDGWTVTTVDHSLAAQFEHTVLVTNSGAEILTA